MTRTRANACLLLVALLWGLGNVAGKTALDHLGPFTGLGARCLIGFFVILPMAYAERRRMAPAGPVRPSLFLAPSMLFFVALGSQHLAILGTSVTNVGFLINASVMFTPFVEWGMLGRRPRTTTLVAAAIAAAGVTLMTGGLDGPAWGDAACLVSALFYSVWIVQVSRVLAVHERPFALAASQFAVAGILGIGIGTMTETIEVGRLLAAAPDLAMMGILSTGIAYGLQLSVQRWTPPSDAVIVLSAECVFGAAAAVWFLSERPGMGAVAGAVAILIAIVVVQRPARSLGSPKDEEPTRPTLR